MTYHASTFKCHTILIEAHIEHAAAITPNFIRLHKISYVSNAFCRTVALRHRSKYSGRILAFTGVRSAGAKLPECRGPSLRIVHVYKVIIYKY